MSERFQPWVGELIQKHGGIYTTTNNLQLIVFEDESFTFVGRWPSAEIPGTPTVRIDIGRQFEDFCEFDRVFPIRQLNDLDNLTQEGLFKLYGLGEICISALVEEEWIFEDLTFRIQNGATWIWDNELDEIIPYSDGLLSTPEQITNFTRKHIFSKYPLLMGTRLPTK